MSKFFSVFLSVLFAATLVACGPTKTIQEIHPGVQFMGQQQATAYVSGHKFESDKAVTTYNENGTADVYVKSISRSVKAKWKVMEDGMVVFKTSRRTINFYLGLDGNTSYKTTGEAVSFKRSE